MRKLLTIVMLTCTLAAVYRCRPGSEGDEIRAWHRNVEDEKQQLIQELDAVNDLVDEQLEHAEEYAETTDEDKKGIVNNVKRRLQTENKNIEKLIFAVRSSTEDTWDDVKEDSDVKLTDAKIELSRIREKIRNEIDESK
jgi:hypothetical protein